jgi:hypothetical protein
MARVVFLVPYRQASEWRDKLWDYTHAWIRNGFRHRIYTGAGPDGPFNRGAAINEAARKAGKWDLAVITDSDNIMDPWMLKLAIGKLKSAQAEGGVGCIYPFSTYMYLDEFSTRRILDWSHMMDDDMKWAFLAPEHHKDGFRRSVRYHHASGIQIVTREAYEAVGGFIELQGWGAEDEIMRILFEKFGGGVRWQSGGAYHLWHPANRNNPDDPYDVANHKVLADVSALVVVPDQLKEYLRNGGHPIP